MPTSGLLMLLCAGAYLGQEVKPAQKHERVKISVETTYFEGPLTDDGYVDYEKALNEALRKRTPPAQNAYVVLLEAIGPNSEATPTPEALFRALDCKPLPKEGNYLISPDAFARSKGIEMETFLDQIESATEKPWNAKQLPNVKAWLDVNATPLDVAVKASDRPRFYIPQIIDRAAGKRRLSDVRFDGLMSLSEFQSLLAARAMLAVGDKRYDAAWRDATTLDRLGRSIATGATAMEGIVGYAFVMRAAETHVRLLDAAAGDAKVGAGQLKGWLANLRARPPLPTMADKVLVAERCWFLDVFTDLDRGRDLTKAAFPVDDGASQLLFQDLRWEAGLTAANAWFDRVGAAFNEPDAAKRREKVEALEREAAKSAAEMKSAKTIFKRLAAAKNAGDAKGKAVVDVVLSTTAPGILRLGGAWDRVEATRALTQVAVALAIVHRDSGMFPKTLDELVPALLPRVPEDPYTGQRVRYHRTEDGGTVISSAGPDGGEDGGFTNGLSIHFDNKPFRVWGNW